MGQTLTHGIYLPDEGERNCYDGLASNWSILDGAVGTVAEHTTQIAGKAPAVHTHTKADITDFPSYGTTAGTICEGNDSRLSDARTPVAHTHTKADVTDLLNSNFIPSANNSYDLGSSSYQWNNLYAKNYYYNGTAWGLDKNNWWSLAQFYAQNSIHVRNVDPGVTPSSEVTAGFRMENANASYAFGDVLCKVNTNGTTYIMLTASNKFSNGALDPNGTTASRGLQIGLRSDGTGFLYTDCGWRNNLVPHSLEPNLSLGTSTNKWKTLNGVNPGALSIFNPSATQDPIDVPNTWVTDGSAWNTLNVSNMGDGWICLTYKLCGANDYILARFGGTSATTYPSMIFPATMLHDSKYYLYILMPVAKAMGNIYLEIKLDSNAVLVKHSFIPAYGTV